jgi:hypothetical protein
MIIGGMKIKMIILCNSLISIDNPPLVLTGIKPQEGLQGVVRRKKSSQMIIETGWHL